TQEVRAGVEAAGSGGPDEAERGGEEARHPRRDRAAVGGEEAVRTAAQSFEPSASRAGLIVHACFFANSISAGARKFAGKITHGHSFGSSSATYFASRSLAGFTSIFSGIASPSSNALATGARARR